MYGFCYEVMNTNITEEINLLIYNYTQIRYTNTSTDL